MLTPQDPVVGLVEPGQQRRWMDITGENRAALPCEVEIIERSLRNCNIAWGTPVNR